MESKLNVVCYACGAVNRLPSSRLSENPSCGKCKQALLPDHPVELDDASFLQYVTRTEIPVVIDFWAPWCGPCRTMAPEFSAAAKKLAPHVLLAKLNTEDSPQTASVYDISGIPCLIAFKNGKEFARQSGMMNAKQIEDWVNSLSMVS